MRALRFAILSVLVLLVALSGGASIGAAQPAPSSGEAPLMQARGAAIAGQYIVVLKSGHDPRGVASSAAARPQHTYDTALNGFAASLTPRQVAMLRRQAGVEFIEEDAQISIDGIETMDAQGNPWGLDRIDQVDLPLNGTYTYHGDGANVHAYIIDTGIQTNHPDVVGRASVGYDAVGGRGQDCNGHGTHVAATVGGSVYGVAKRTSLVAVRVLNCSGSGTTSGVIAGINWVASHSIHPAVANMSLGGGFSAALNQAATNLVDSGVFLAVAAGNNNADACETSPASADRVFSTAASDKTDGRASFSNFGSCVTGYAPGVAIKSAWLRGGTNTISGTSMATPHVTGVAALYKGIDDAPASEIITLIQTNGSQGVIHGNPAGTPNVLVLKNNL
jgi:subtilisin family serine protease